MNSLLSYYLNVRVALYGICNGPRFCVAIYHLSQFLRHSHDVLRPILGEVGGFARRDVGGGGRGAVGRREELSVARAVDAVQIADSY